MKISSIAKKIVLALTGLALVGFLVAHLAGNFLLFAGPETFNAYAHLLESKKALLVGAEVGLLILFVAHIYWAIKATLENRAARPKGYEFNTTAGESTLASRFMIVTGVLTAIFVILHIKMFKFGNHDQPLGLWGLVVGSFQDPLVMAFYVVAMLILGFHLSHGVASAFQSLGVLKPGQYPKARKLGLVVGWLIALGFALLPIWAFFLAEPLSKKTPSEPAIEKKDSTHLEEEPVK